MMNDMMPTINEAITPDIAAQLEFEEWQRDEEARERWEAAEAIHGPLMTQTDWQKHSRDFEAWLETC